MWPLLFIHNGCHYDKLLNLLYSIPSDTLSFRETLYFRASRDAFRLLVFPLNLKMFASRDAFPNLVFPLKFFNLK